MKKMRQIRRIKKFRNYKRAKESEEKKQQSKRWAVLFSCVCVHRVSVPFGWYISRAKDNMVQIKNERMYVERKMVFIAGQSLLRMEEEQE